MKYFVISITKSATDMKTVALFYRKGGELVVFYFLDDTTISPF